MNPDEHLGISKESIYNVLNQKIILVLTEPGLCPKAPVHVIKRAETDPEYRKDMVMTTRYRHILHQLDKEKVARDHSWLDMIRVEYLQVDPFRDLYDDDIVRRMLVMISKRTPKIIMSFEEKISRNMPMIMSQLTNARWWPDRVWIGVDVRSRTYKPLSELGKKICYDLNVNCIRKIFAHLN